CLRRGIGIVEFDTGADVLVCIGPRRAEREMRLSDGTTFRPGDRVLELHLWNEHLLTLPPRGPTLRRAVAARRQVMGSLCRLATHLQSAPDLGEVKALCIKPAFASGNLARNLNWLATKHGFESVADHRNPASASGAYG